MNALINNQKIYCEPAECGRKRNKTYLGDVLATAIVTAFTVTSLTISGWSALLFITGQVEEGGPLGRIFNFVYTLVNTSGVL